MLLCSSHSAPASTTHRLTYRGLAPGGRRILLGLGAVSLMVGVASCRLAPASGRKDQRVCLLDAEGEPVVFRAVRGGGGLTLSLQARPPRRFLADPLYRAEAGELFRLASSDTWLNLGYIPPERVAARLWVTIDWVVVGPAEARESGVTRVQLEASPERGLRVLHAENDLDAFEGPPSK